MSVPTARRKPWPDGACAHSAGHGDQRGELCVISARQVSVVVGAALGVWLLKERYGAIRIASSLLICAGVVTIGLA